MKELDTKEMDKDEKELYQMLRSKFNTEEMERLAKLMIIDAEKYHQNQLKKNCVLDLVSYSVAQQYAEFCVRCDREKLPLIKIDDYLKQL